MTNKPLDTSGFTGTEVWHRHWLMKGITFTDGVKYVADTAGAYWLIDEIALVQMEPLYRNQPFQQWSLEVAGSKAILTCEDGNGNQISSKSIPLTDFPEPGIKIWFTNNVILLPSEY